MTFSRIYIKNPIAGDTYQKTIDDGFTSNIWLPNLNNTRSQNYFNNTTNANIWLQGVQGAIFPNLSRSNNGSRPYVVNWNLQIGTGTTGFNNLPQAVSYYTAGEQTAYQNIVSNVSNFANISFVQGVNNPNYPSDLLFRFNLTPNANQSGASTTTAVNGQNRVSNINAGDDVNYYGESTIKFPSQNYVNTYYNVGNNSQDTFRNQSVTAGSFLYYTMLHELGHFLGLSHTHDGAFPGVPNSGTQVAGTNGLNSVLSSIMSYRLRSPNNSPNALVGTNSFSTLEGLPTSFMALDIAQLQRIYGLNSNYNLGNNTYYLPDANDTSDAIGANAGWSCIWDAGGDDTLSAGNDTARSVNIDLRGASLGGANDQNATGYFSYESGVKGGISIAHDWDGVDISNSLGLCVIENAIGGAFNDRIIGNHVANSLSGRSGNDLIYGQAGRDSIFGEDGNDTLYGDQDDDFLRGGTGNDLLDGGAGVDRASYIDATSGVTVSLSNRSYQAVGGGRGSDKLANIENLLGGGFNDSLTGNNSNNTLEGGEGDDSLFGFGGNDSLYGGDGYDLLRGGAGNDLIDGGSGDDKVSFALATGSISVSLLNNETQLIGGGEGSDRIINIEDVLGGRFNDTISGNDSNNTIEGNDGNDVIFARAGNDYILGGAGNDFIRGGAGNDTIFGGSGIDRASYIDASSGVTVNLSISQRQDIGGDLGSDTLQEIEDLLGSAFADDLTGSDGNNTIDADDGNDTILALGGNDTIYGRGGSDRIRGGAGNDIIDGGEGSDRASFYDATSSVTVDLRNTNAQNVGGGLGSDKLINVESVLGGLFNDLITGNTLANQLEGDNGNDSIYGLEGNDRLYGGNGADLLRGGLGDDLLDGGADQDRASFVDATAGIAVDLRRDTSQLIGGGLGSDTLVDIEDIVGGAFNDNIIGNVFANTLEGAAGNDTISGGGGNDYIVGGQGADLLEGGEGNDIFSFSSADSLLNSYDRVTDFAVGQDKISLATIDANSAISGDQAFTFIGVAAFSTNMAGQLRYSGGFLYGNTNNDTTADFKIQIDTAGVLTSGDFYL